MLETVQVQGDVQALWQVLLGTLYTHEYAVQSQSPYAQLTATRGSKVSSLLFEGTKSGFRQLNVTFAPQEGNLTEVRFGFDFASWAITLSGTKQECSDLVDEFASLAGQGATRAPTSAGEATAIAPAPAPPALAGDTVACPSCGAQVRRGARFCDSCGAAVSAKVCAKCGLDLRPGAKFCDSCGARV